MVVSIGHDIVNIQRIDQILQEKGARFLERIFTLEERAYCAGKADPSSCYAKRWAAKEAFAKALGTGFAEGLSWQHIFVKNMPSGAPTIELTPPAENLLARKFGEDKAYKIHLSLSDDAPFASAFVVISHTN